MLRTLDSIQKYCKTYFRKTKTLCILQLRKGPGKVGLYEVHTIISQGHILPLQQ